MNNDMDYRKYLDIWIDSLSSEIQYWDYVMRTNGGIYFTSFERMVQPNKKFIYEKHFQRISKGKFIDVGSGPFSTAGFVTEKAEVDVTCVDPLGEVYNHLKKKYGLENGLEIATGFVECLDKSFPANTFDMVHMNNALDHCFDPIHGIRQMIYIAKHGGTIRLSHAENEAEHNRYSGLHQWNIEEKNNTILLWNKKSNFDICKLFAKYVTFSIETKYQLGRKFVTINMIKKKDIDMSANHYYDMLLMAVYSNLLNQILEKVYAYNDCTVGTDHSKLLESLRLAFEDHRSALQKFLSQYASVVIYGMGGLGIAFQNVCEELGIKVVETLDKKPLVATKSPDVYEWDKESLIVLTMTKSENVEKKMSRLARKDMVIHIKDIIAAVK